MPCLLQNSYFCAMNPRNKKIQIPSFGDTTVIGINSSMVDYRLAWNINNKLSIDLARYDDLIFEGNPFSFFYYSAGDNYNVYNLVSLTYRERVLYAFTPRLDYLFLIQNHLPAEKLTHIMRNLREIEGLGHAFLLEKDKNLRQVLETIADSEQRMMDKKKKRNDINEIRRQMREEEIQQKAFWASAKP